MSDKKNFSWKILFLVGVSLILIGGYFIFLRPALLPEDIRFMGIIESQEKTFINLASPWLKAVFTVLGGYIVSSGLMFAFLAYKYFKKFNVWVWITVFLSGFFSIGTMTIINFKIGSDFKWWLLILSLIWISSLILNLMEQSKSKKDQQNILE